MSPTSHLSICRLVVCFGNQQPRAKSYISRVLRQTRNGSEPSDLLLSYSRSSRLQSDTQSFFIIFLVVSDEKTKGPVNSATVLSRLLVADDFIVGENQSPSICIKSYLNTTSVIVPSRSWQLLLSHRRDRCCWLDGCRWTK